MAVKKKLLVTASTFPRWEGDTEPRFILDYAKAITPYYDVTVLVPAACGAKDKEVLEGVNIVRYHYFPIHKWETLCYPGAIVPRIREKKVRVLLVPFLLLSLWFHLLRLLPKYDIVHANWLIPQGIIQSFFKKPYIITGHGGDISSFNKGILKKLKKRCMDKAGEVIVVSGYKQQELKEIYPGICSRIISMGVNTELFNREQNHIDNFFEQGNQKVVLYVGRLAEIKGVNFLIEAMQYVNNAKLVIVGDGPERRHLEEIADRSSARIAFLGSKTHEELKVIYASADILVVPSVTDSNGAQEGLPTVIMEAFASKLAVIATRTGGIPNLLKDGGNGLLVEEKSAKEIAAAINRLLTDGALYERVTAEAYLAAKENDYSKVAEKYHKVIERILD